MERLGYRPALDGLRGVAILLVLGEHAFRFPLHGGYGVILFFVLSGYLITTLILEERDRTGTVSLSRFYVRRARRLLPALFAMLATYAFVEATLGRGGDAIRRVAAAGFYTANFFQAFWPHVIGASGLGPLWSLAEEEQFYLVVPFALLVALRFVSERTVQRVALGLAAAVIVERFALAAAGVTGQRIYCGPDTSMDGFLVGLALALKLRRPAAPRMTHRARNIAALAGTLIVFDSVLPFQIGAPVIDAASVLLICAAVGESSLLKRALEAAPLVAVGKISYSLYLWHAPILYWFRWRSPGHGTLDATTALAVAFLAAWLSYRFVEQPFRRRRSRLERDESPPSAATQTA